MPNLYDGLVLGAGHNALILQAYLCRSGLRVLSLDRAPTPGGGLRTESNPRAPGFLHNTHSFFHRAVTEMPWYRDLELRRHGAEYLEPELNVAMLLPDGRSLQWWTDLERTVDSFRGFSRRDAEAVRRWADEFRPIVEEILIPEAQSPPLPAAERAAQLRRSPLGRRLLEVSALSPLEFVEREFEDAAVRGGLLFFNGLREVDLRMTGFGHSIPALLAQAHMAQMCVGGSARLAEALVADIREHGGEVRTDCELRQILMDGGRAVGVELAGGERIGASGFIASGLSPQQTFVGLIEAQLPLKRIRERAEQFRYNLLAPLFALNVALREPPEYRAAREAPDVQRALMVILGLEDWQQFGEIVDAHQRGAIPRTVMWGACPTVFDPSQAPPGGHSAFMWEKLPYRLDGDPANWDRAAEAHGREMLQLWAEFAPNLKGDVVIDSFVRTPLDVERTLPNMQEGDLLVGSFDHGQIGENRPFPGAGNYRTPIPGLYLCGGATHPGGNVTGLCGYNAARVVSADLALRRWWRVPQLHNARSVD